jgi:GntR family histidine utilization transcriptional repressor
LTSEPLKKEKVSLHQQIRRDIADQIRLGQLRPGDKIPFEYQLMQTYGCARMTVNKALSTLSDEGLIERRKRAGTFVRGPRLDSTVLDIPDIESEITGKGELYRFKLLSRDTRRAQTDEEIELAGDGQVLVLKGIHFKDGRSLAVEQRLINLAAVPEAAEIDYDPQSPGHWLLQAVPWTRAESQIAAEVAPAETARLAGWRRGTACLVVERKTWRGGERITTVRQVFDGAAYRLIARFDHA